MKQSRFSIPRLPLLVAVLGFVLLFPSPGFTQAPKGQIVAQLPFDPKVHGFGFPNYVNDAKQKGLWEDDLKADDMIELFGAPAVCQKSTIDKECVLTAAARKWMEEALEGMKVGHCEGMAVTSLRLLANNSFKHKSKPADFQPGARATKSLQRTAPVENFIAYYFITQRFDDVQKPSRKTAKEGPAAIVDLLIQGLKQGVSPGSALYSLGIYKYAKGRLTDGHAITPFKVEDMGGGHFRIHVYDNNYPGETRYVEVDKNLNKWSYRTSTEPGASETDYVGDAKTQSLELTANSWRERKFEPPFGKDTEDSAPRGGAASMKGKSAKDKSAGAVATDSDDSAGEEVEFELYGDGEFLVLTPEGKRVGFDFRADQFINEAGATIVALKGGSPPIYQLPYTQQRKPYTVQISGSSLEEETDADLVFSGPGFTIGFEDILLDPAEVLVMKIRPDGRELSFTASQDGETPSLFFAVDADGDGASYLFEVGGVTLEGGKTLTVSLDMKGGKVAFQDDDGNEDAYDVEMLRINGDGTEQSYKSADLDMGKADSYQMDFGQWDGKSPICFQDDDDGNGFANDECEPQANEESPGEPGPHDEQPEQKQPDDAQPDDAPKGQKQPDDAQPDDAQPDEEKSDAQEPDKED